MLNIILIFIVLYSSAMGQTTAFGKTIYEWGKSPSSLKWHFRNGGQPHIALDLQDSSNGWTGFEDENGTSAGSGGVVAAPLNTTQRIRIERNGQVLTASVDGVLAFTSSANFGPLISRTSGVVINVYDGQGGTFEIDNFSIGGVTDAFNGASSPNWRLFYELPAVGTQTPFWGPTPVVTQQLWDQAAQIIDARIANGALRLGPSSQQNWPAPWIIADYTRPVRGNFVMQFDFRRITAGGDFRVMFTTGRGTSGGSLMDQTPMYVTTLRTRFNKRTGKVEATKNGVMTHRGFLKFLPSSRLNRRQLLRGYR